MLHWLKGIGYGVIGIVLAVLIGSYILLRQSLPELEGKIASSTITHPATLARDALGQAIITADNRPDAMYLLGYAHAQDRFFQMDLQRRVAAGELAEWLGDAVIDVDKANRFHQFRRRAQDIIARLPAEQKQLFERYSQGVNDALATFNARSFEYLLTGFTPKPWLPEDSILTIFSMYLDLQGNTIRRDLALSRIEQAFGPQMVAFLSQSSQYQAALDGSIIDHTVAIPTLNRPVQGISENALVPLDFSPEVGSNNWGVSGQLTQSGQALIANDMHLGLRVPIIWYRTQLHYTRANQPVTVTGVSLPGAPAVIVGTNGQIAWGFTNSYIDVADWLQIEDVALIREVPETLRVGKDTHHYTRLESPWGPVKKVGDDYYALQWVAHHPYAVNVHLTDLDLQSSVDEALPVIHSLGMPVQNIVVGDSQGNLAWTFAGAVPARKHPHNTAVAARQAQPGWDQNEHDLPVVKNPAHGRIWSANSRVISAEALTRFGDGGYALGARSAQIRDRLFEQDRFDEADFYQLQLDNEARFLQPWHALLSELLATDPETFAADIHALQHWGNCACSDSIGYTLVKAFRQRLISAVFAPLRQVLDEQGVDLSPALNNVEPAMWQLINSEAASWLPTGQTNWQDFMRAQYAQAKQRLQSRYGDAPDLSPLAWGKVNALQIKHPFAQQIPILGERLNMPSTPGFGDTFMPAVQRPSFGASQRFFVQPGKLDSAVLTLPGGQSAHPLSEYYQAGYNDYATHQATPLLPGQAIHTLTFTPITP